MKAATSVDSQKLACSRYGRATAGNDCRPSGQYRAKSKRLLPHQVLLRDAMYECSVSRPPATSLLVLMALCLRLHGLLSRSNTSLWPCTLSTAKSQNESEEEQHS